MKGCFGTLIVAAIGLVALAEDVPYPPADIRIQDESDFFDLLDLERPELANVRVAVEAEDWVAAQKAWANHLETREYPRWTWSYRDRDAIMAILDDIGEGLGQHVAKANRVLARDLRGAWGIRLELDHEIEWLQGPNEQTHVLSRHRFWQPLGYAYLATGDNRYAEDFVYTLTHWITSNPVPRRVENLDWGPQGTVWRTLETGIRADGWFDVMELFMDAPEFDAEAKYLMTKSLVEHARHLHRFTVEFRPGNWQVVECSGLAVIGIMLPEFKEANDWRERAFEYLVAHMQRTVYPDGAYTELTPGYHRWVMERFLKVSLLAQRNGYEIPALLDRHEKMFEFLMHISKPDRYVPTVGDAQRMSVEPYMGLGALLYDRPDMRYLGASEIMADWVWMFGAQVVEHYEGIAPEPPSFTSSMLPHAQYCMMRTGWDASDRYLLFDCAPWGGHSHHDRLQVIVYAGRDLLVDPGTYSYDEPLHRRYFVKSEAHNVLLVDEMDQPHVDPVLLTWKSNDRIDFASGEIADDAQGFRHRRNVLFVKPDYWIVVDHVFGGDERKLTRLFHFPLVDVVFEGQTAHTDFPEGTNIAVTALDDSNLEMRQGWIPTSGDTADQSPVAAFVNQTDLPVAVGTVLIPYVEKDALPAITVVENNDPLIMTIRLEFPDGQVDKISIAPDITDLILDGETVPGRAICARNGPRYTSMSIVDGGD